MQDWDFGSKWAANNRNISIQCLFGNDQLAAVQRAVNSWNSVNDLQGDDIITLNLTTSYTGNSIDFRSMSTDIAGYTELNDDNSANEIKSATVYLNSLHSWATDGTSYCLDIESVALHELGHFLGIAHCHEQADMPAGQEEGPCWSSACLTNVMNPITEKGEVNTTLKSYDTSSYIVIYMND